MNKIDINRTINILNPYFLDVIIELINTYSELINHKSIINRYSAIIGDMTLLIGLILYINKEKMISMIIVFIIPLKFFYFY